MSRPPRCHPRRSGADTHMKHMGRKCCLHLVPWCLQPCRGSARLGKLPALRLLGNASRLHAATPQIRSRERETGATRSARDGGAVFRGQRLDAGERGAGADDDGTRAGAFLRRAGAAEEHAGDHDAELPADGADHGDVGAGRVQLVLWRERAGDRRIRARLFAGRRRGAESGLRGNDSADRPS